MKSSLQTFFSLIIFITFFSNVYAQNGLDGTLSKLTQDAAGHYVAPLVSGFGADMNAGWIAPIPKPVLFSIDVNFRFVAMGAFFSDADKSFSTNAKFRFNRDEATLLTQDISDESTRQAVINQILSQDFNIGVQGPTIIGKKDDHIIVNFKGATFVVNGTPTQVGAKTIESDINGKLDGLPIMPLAVPQISLGTVYGSRLSIRFLPSIKLSSDLGDFNYFGIGIMHNPGIWLSNPLPLDVAVGIFTQTMKVGNVFNSSATQFSIFAGKTFGPSMLNVQPYAGLSVETSTTTVKYQEKFDTPTGVKTLDISFDSKSDNSFKFTLGSAFKLSAVFINIDYSFASHSTVSLGLGVDF